MSDNQACANTDRELYREPGKDGDDFFQPSIHVTERGSIGIHANGSVIVMTLRDWHAAGRIYSEGKQASTPTSPDGESATKTTRAHDKDMLIAGFKHDLAKARSELERVKAERTCLAVSGEERGQYVQKIGYLENERDALRSHSQRMREALEKIMWHDLRGGVPAYDGPCAKIARAALTPETER